MNLEIETPEWAVPLYTYARYKGIWGGRGGGKSHERGEALIEELVLYPNKACVCLREVQKSIKFSVKRLLEQKIRNLKLEHLFEIQDTVIKRRGYEGIIIFQGMQDHTADSIKSLEGFDIAWFEEAQSASARSLRLLRPTIRKPGSEMWFTWNPDQEDDPIDRLLRSENPPPGSIVINANYYDNPWLPKELKEEMEFDREYNPDDYNHTWLGGYNVRSNAQVFGGKWIIKDFEINEDWDGPYHGLDFGFSEDPLAFIRCWIHDNYLYIDRDTGGSGIENNEILDTIRRNTPDIHMFRLPADNSRPETISYLKNHGLPYIHGAPKWPGSVQDGITFLRSFKKIVIHPSCKHMIQEALNYKYKEDPRTGDILPDIIDKHNHRWDAVRYALNRMIKRKRLIFEAS